MGTHLLKLGYSFGDMNVPKNERGHISNRIDALTANAATVEEEKPRGYTCPGQQFAGAPVTAPAQRGAKPDERIPILGTSRTFARAITDIPVPGTGRNEFMAVRLSPEASRWCRRCGSL
ncbi:hypothetical protein [Desulfoscipio geothermicus]|uniref:hypothetical protein n=1 Tax=Desulfoscipio geothermicus TaxID=39060 RepID=UPI000B88E025|nr:hypothetical protein [Desulfoscipio geothermicus]